MVLPDFLLILGILIGGAGVYVAVSALIESISASQNIALSWSSGDAPKKSKSPLIRLIRPLIHKLILPLLARYKLEGAKERIKRDIQSAGLSHELNENEFIGLVVFLGIVFPIFLTVLNFLFEMGYPWWGNIIFGIVAGLFPSAYVRGEKNARRGQILVDLPFVVDLLALSTKPGLDFIGAIQRVVDKMTGGPLAEEMAQVLRDLKLGSSRADALNGLAWRLNMSEVSSFIAVLTTADALGAGITDVLRQQSDQMRQERFVRAEKAGAEASQKIFLPIVAFILPAVMLMVFGPLILQFMGVK